MSLKAIGFTVDAEWLMPNNKPPFNTLHPHDIDIRAAEKLTHLLAPAIQARIRGAMVSEPHKGLLLQGTHTTHRVELVVMTPRQLMAYVEQQIDKRQNDAFEQIRILLDAAPTPTK